MILAKYKLSLFTICEGELYMCVLSSIIIINSSWILDDSVGFTQLFSMFP